MSKSVESVPVLQGALRRVLEGEEYRRLAAAVAGGKRVVSVAGLTSAPARALALAALQRETGRRFAVLVAANRDMEAWERDLSFWCAALRRDEDYSPEDLVEVLLASGYVREDPVGAVGEFSMRGGILDVWSPGEPFPVRVEFFGDTVDSVRRFNPETQLSVEQLQSTEIVPMREL